jgi:hypothetical protein
VKFIAPGRAIAADDIDFRVWKANGSGKIGTQVEDTRIVMLHLAGAMIAKEMVELLFGFGEK